MAVRTNSHYRSMLAMIATAIVATGCIDDDEDDDTVAGSATPPPDAPADNNPPSISGDPPDAVDSGSAFIFQPTAADPDNDPLFFSITNKPRWANFDTSSGALYGRPGDSDVGSFANMSIYVSDGKTSRGLGPFRIDVRKSDTDNGNSAPVIAGTPPATVEAGSFYSFQPTASDVDSDTLSFSVANRPSWLQFDPATGRLSGTPAAANAGTYRDIRVSVSDGQATAALPEFDVTVTVPVAQNRAPTIGGSPATAVVAGSAYVFQPTAADADGDRLTFSISNRPGWLAFDNRSGRLSGTPAIGNAGTYTGIVISVSDGQTSASLAPFAITVTEPETPNNAPVITGTPPGTVEAGSAYSFRPSASDPDNDALTFSITGRPGWLSFNTSNGRLSGTPSANDVGTFSGIVIRVSDGEASAALPAFAITVTEADEPNTAPVISGAPATAVEVGQNYRFVPTASDADNDALTFSISGRPNWLSFDTATGELSGAPAAGDVGEHGGIVISVSDGEDSVSLPAFAITVSEADAPNTAPVIAGTPATEAVVGTEYSFTPTATDADNDTLTFSISGRPAWAAFDSATGRLSGTPAAGDVGSYNGIVISVDDGTDTADLAPFSISVTASATGSITVSWTAPTENDDGSPLTDLAGYKIYYGTEPGNYTTRVDVDSAGVTTWVIDELPAGTYYLAATSVNGIGVESVYSAEVVKQVAAN